MLPRDGTDFISYNRQAILQHAERVFEMKTTVARIPPILFLLIAGALPVMPQEKAPESKLVEFQMALYKRPAQSDPNSPKAAPQALKEQHIAYVVSLLEAGKAIIAGPLDEDGE